LTGVKKKEKTIRNTKGGSGESANTLGKILPKKPVEERKTFEGSGSHTIELDDDVKSEKDSLITNEDRSNKKKNTKDKDCLFPIFESTFERKGDGVQRICIRCLKSKPDRCHHCSICNTCILMMDHHCPWLNNCIGFNNYKYFFDTIFYCTISSTCVSLTYWQVWGKLLDDPDTNFFILYLCSVTYFLAFIFTIVLIGFTCFHIRLMITSYTTLEYCEKRRGTDSTWAVSPYYSTRWCYNMSLKLGFDCWILWFLPFGHTKHRGQGRFFQVYDDEKMKDNNSSRDHGGNPHDKIPEDLSS
jgi:hypothetical protein